MKKYTNHAAAWALVLVLVPVVGCSSSEDTEEEEPIAPRIEEVEEHIVDLREEAETHTAAVNVAADLDEVATVEEDDAVSMAVEMLHHKIMEVGECHDSADEEADVSALMDLVEQCEDALEEHTTAMGAVTTLEEAIEDEDQHLAALGVLLDSLESEREDVASKTTGMTCPPGEDDDHHEGH